MSTERKSYVVEAVRDQDGWWIIEVPEVDGAMTQAPRLDQVDEMARDTHVGRRPPARRRTVVPELGRLWMAWKRSGVRVP